MSPSEQYLGNPHLKKANTRLEFTSDQIAEYIKCSKDPIYFCKNYVKIVSVDDGVVPFKMRKFQEKLVQRFHKHRFNICKMPRQCGKCFHINTSIKVRNKITGEIIELTVGELYDKIKEENNSDLS